jgi:hypothetical protein
VDHFRFPFLQVIPWRRIFNIVFYHWFSFPAQIRSGVKGWGIKINFAVKNVIYKLTEFI